MRTTSGFECDIDRERLKNMELVDALADMQDDDVLAVSRVVRLLFTKEEKKRLYDHLRTPDGRVPPDAIGVELNEIFSMLGEEGKKS